MIRQGIDVKGFRVQAAVYQNMVQSIGDTL
jgi:hypothetical protein